MLKLNKYLREIGIDENSYPFNEKERQLDCRYKEDEDGFAIMNSFLLITL